MPLFFYQKVKSVRGIVLLSIVCSALIFFSIATSYAFAMSPVSPVTLAPNGSVSALVVGTTTTYIGGTFTAIAKNTNKFGVFATSTGSTTRQFPTLGSSNGQVVISDNNGGWYVGGNFATADTYTRNRIVHILSNGTVDPNFDPNLGGFSGSENVNALALSPDGNTLYVGGIFTTVNGGTTRNYLAAFNTSNGTVTSWNPNPDNYVYALKLNADGSTLYVGGDFGTIGGQTRNGIASFTTSDGTVTSFHPDITGTSPAINSLALSPDEAYLYFGGNFTNVGASSRANLAAVATSTGAATSFDPQIVGEVTSIAISSEGATVYTGGSFNGANSVNGNTTRNRLAAFASTTGTVIAGFDPNLNNGVNSIVLSPDGNTLYAGGLFNTVNGGGTTRNRIAAFTTSNGTVVAGFDPNMSGQVFGIALSSNAGIAATGAFTRSNPVTRNRLAAFDNATGDLVTGFDPNVSGTVSALALSPDGNTLYFGGTFSGSNSVNGNTTRNRLAAVSTSNGTVVAGFDPNVGSTGVNALALSSDGATLYVGGTFSGSNSVNGNTTRNNVAAFTTADGLVTNFNPDIGSTVNSLALTSDNSKLYVGGSFTTVAGGATTRNRLASFTTSNGVATNFDPNVSSGGIFALALSLDNSVIYAGGSNTGVVNGGALTRNRFAAFTTADGVVTNFDPNFGNNVNAIRVTSDGGTIYVGGSFTTIAGGGTTRNRLATFTTSDGVVTSYNPNLSATVSAIGLASDDSVLALGGNFTSTGGTSYARQNYAQFVGPGTPTSLGGVSFVNGSPSSSTAPTLSFSIAHASSTATVKYQLQVSTSSSFSTTAIDYASALGSGGSKSFTVGQAAGSGTYTVGSASQTLSDGNYYWRVKTIDQTTDSSGYKSANLGAVAFIVDTIVPMISSVSASSNSSGATITWTTDTVADSKVQYGASSSYGSETTLADTSGVTSHSVSVTGLSSCTTYHYRVNSNDLAGNTATSSDATFVTTGCSSGGSGGGGGGGGSSGGSRVATPVKTSTTTPSSITPNNQISVPGAVTQTAPIPELQRLSNSPDISWGSSSEYVLLLQRFLNTQGFTIAKTGPGSVGNETTVFGPATRAALVKFQTTHGISPAVGYFGPKTRAFIVSMTGAVAPIVTVPASSSVAISTFTRDLEFGMNGTDVTLLQTLLIKENAGPAALSLKNNGVSTYFGSLTKAALIEYQIVHGIIPSLGYFGPKTQASVLTNQ